jgi:2-dehydro-3-deoxygalactonokinase
MTQLIGLDWGTTSLRAYRFDAGGQVVDARHRPLGILQVAAADAGAGDGFARALDQACGDWISADPACALLACGMIGSAQGWRQAPYVEVPAGVDALGGALTAVETPRGVLHIVPGMIARGALPEVMRGEETQVAGVVDPASGGPADAWIGLPGTHAKWVRVRDRRIVELHTFMTGEVFAALCAHTILGRTMQPAAAPDLAAFDRGAAVARSPDGRLGVLSTMFSARTLGLVGELPGEAQADYLSGLLIGHEVAALGELGDRSEAIALVGDAALCERYRRALVASGHTAVAIAGGATERGLWRIAVAAGLVAGAASSSAM